MNKVLSRTRKSFLAKHKRTISHGYITPQMEAKYSEMTLPGQESTLSLEEEDDEELEKKKDLAGSSSTGRLSKDGTASFSSAESPTSDQMQIPALEAKKQSSVLRKLRLHK
jgi:hypothetical protein